MIVRQYSNKDKKSIIDLLRGNTPDYFAPEEEADLIFYLDNYAQNYFVVEIDNRIVGSGGYNIDDDGTTAKISWDIVDSKIQNRGIGTLLTKHRINLIVQDKKIDIISVRTSQLVYKFYEKFGLELKEVISDYWADGFDLYRLNCKVEAIKQL